jgi:transposase InsO family protein
LALEIFDLLLLLSNLLEHLLGTQLLPVKPRRYGSPRITQQLRQEGVICGENRVARLMRENELAARRKKAFRPRTTLPGQGAAPNLIKELEPSVPNQVWVSDITYVATLEGWLYLAVILDLFSRRVAGWKLGESLEAELVVTALKIALVLRQPERGLYFHSDRGSQYSSQAVRKPLSVIGANQSMSGLGNCYDNAQAEAFFSTLKTECFPDNHTSDQAVLDSPCEPPLIRKGDSDKAMEVQSNENAALLKLLKTKSRTVPVNQSAGPLTEGCEPLLLMSIFIWSYYFPSHSNR